MRKILAILIFVLLLVFGFYFLFDLKNSKNLESTDYIDQSTRQLVEEPVDSVVIPEKEIVEPIANALARVSKKPFGLKVSPSNSPVSPERFAGYHTGVDFETTEAEQNTAVPIYAICPGKLLLKKQASGYGGVAVQSCEINKQVVTVVYGHLQLASISAQVGQELKAGDVLGILGKGYSSETDGERKHLHLSIHLGQQLVFLGYVQQEADLSAWLDPLDLLAK